MAIASRVGNKSGRPIWIYNLACLGLI